MDDLVHLANGDVRRATRTVVPSVATATEVRAAINAARRLMHEWAREHGFEVVQLDVADEGGVIVVSGLLRPSWDGIWADIRHALELDETDREDNLEEDDGEP